jgi:predicted nucleic acid-binding protein
MIPFFDTSVHVSLLRGTIAIDPVIRTVGALPVRLSGRGERAAARFSGRARRSVERLVAGLLPIPSWRRRWLEAGRWLPRIFRHHEEIGLARLQNDLELALTARYTGSVLVTRARHFEAIRAEVPFELRFVPGEAAAAG